MLLSPDPEGIAESAGVGEPVRTGLVFEGLVNDEVASAVLLFAAELLERAILPDSTLEVNLLLCSLSVGGLLFAELSPSDLTPVVLALPDSEPCGLLLVDVEPAGTLFAAELFSATLPIETLLAVVEEFAVVLSPSETLLRPAADVFSSVWVVAGVALDEVLPEFVFVTDESLAALPSADVEVTTAGGVYVGLFAAADESDDAVLTLLAL